MRVRVSYSTEVSDDDRRAIVRARGDRSGRMATRDEVVEFFTDFGVGWGQSIIENNGRAPSARGGDDA